MIRKFICLALCAVTLASCSSNEVEKGGSGTTVTPGGDDDDTTNGFPIVDDSVEPDISQFSDISGEKRVVYEMHKPTVTPHTNPELFEQVAELSNEFNDDDLGANWSAFKGNFQAWPTYTENVSLSDGYLQLTVDKLEDAPLTVNYGGSNVDYYYSAASVRSEQSVVYGYFEAYMRGSTLEEGTCPAFWLYNLPYLADSNTAYEGKVCYNEIDVIEIQQVPSDYHIQSQNYHMMVWTKSGDSWAKEFVRPYSMMGQNECITKWHPNDDFHLYACENRPDSIIWYIDNVRVASKPNYFWHLETELTLSVGLRTPLQTYINGVSTAKPFDDTEGMADLLPAHYHVDYVRTWTRKDGYDSFRSSKREYDASQFPMDVD
ncbi:MAG: family 16 glycosylhydrolase [Rikenellaceae bacterium]